MARLVGLTAGRPLRNSQHERPRIGTYASLLALASALKAQPNESNFFDTVCFDMSIQSAAGQLWHLGRHYLLVGANVPGTFHPKVFLRLGPKDGILMLGSGNLTSSGWGGNQELGTA